MVKVGMAGKGGVGTRGGEGAEAGAWGLSSSWEKDADPTRTGTRPRLRHPAAPCPYEGDALHFHLDRVLHWFDVFVGAGGLALAPTNVRIMPSTRWAYRPCKARRTCISFSNTVIILYPPFVGVDCGVPLG